MVIAGCREFVLANADQPDSFWLLTSQQLLGAHPSCPPSSSHPRDEAETAVLPLPNDSIGSRGGMTVRRFRKAGHAVIAALRFQSSVEASASAGAQDETTASLPSTSPTLDGTAVDRSSGALEEEEEEERAKGAWAALLRAEPLNQAFDQELASVESYKEAEASADPTALALDLSAGDLMDVDLDQ